LSILKRIDRLDDFPLKYCINYSIMYYMITYSTMSTEFVENLASEMRRGVLTLAVLRQCQAAQYGYSLKQRLAEAGLEINEGTLYPLLRRLEGQRLLTSAWQVTDDERPRRYYLLSELGAQVLTRLASEWCGIIQGLERLDVGKECE
jgi:PadR family transcriptional regulator PadR